jgi:hypothetical protein
MKVLVRLTSLMVFLFAVIALTFPYVAPWTVIVGATFAGGFLCGMLFAVHGLVE